MNLRTEDKGTVLFIHRTALFERCLDALRGRGGSASLAVKRVDEIIDNLSSQANRSARGMFRFTRKGEYRISKCRKISLGCGYRLVCLQKASHLVLLYAGSHDDCFRWIERNKGLEYEIDDVTRAIRVLGKSVPQADDLPEDVREERLFAEAFEASLMSRVDDEVLRKVFPGLCAR